MLIFATFYKGFAKSRISRQFRQAGPPHSAATSEYIWAIFRPGPKAKNWGILLSHLENIIVHQKDEYQEARQKLRDKVYQYKDSNSCARLVKEIYRIV